MTPAFDSQPGVVDIHELRGLGADPEAGPDLLIEIPHGATETSDFERLAAQLTSPLPAGLVDFFHVNTDVGAPELALAVAQRFVLEHPTRVVVIVRCRIPRTLIDCNRRVDAAPEDFKAGKVTPGLMPWITTDDDRALLGSLYRRYLEAVAATSARIGPAGALVQLHSYAPRTLDVDVDLNIVESLHRAYEPKVVETWPLRPTLDVISKMPDGSNLAPALVVETLREGVADLGLQVGESATYPMHPSTLAYAHVIARPGRALCLEVRRDLLADPFDPFVAMHISRTKVARLAGPIANALGRWW